MDVNNNDSDEEYYEDIAFAGASLYMYCDRYIYKEPCMTSRHTGKYWLTEILNGNDSRCQNMFRMDKSVFSRLCSELEVTFGLKGSKNTSVDEMIAMLLYTLGGGHSNRDVQERFQHSGETVSRYFEIVLDAVCRLSISIIKPDDREFKGVPNQILHDSRYYPHFKDAIGAIDGTHIPTVVSGDKLMRFIGRKGVPTQNVMAVVNFDMQFIFTLAGWEGSAHDTRIFLEAIQKPEMNFPRPPKGKYYLVDSGYPQMEGYLRPYKGTYHLPDFRRLGGPRGRQEVFNHAHSSLRGVIERTFGVWKKRWKLLKGMPSFDFKKQAKIVVASMALHNYIRRYASSDKKFSKYSNPNLIVDVEDVGDEDEEYPHLGSGNENRNMNVVRNMIADSLMSNQ